MKITELKNVYFVYIPISDLAYTLITFILFKRKE